MKKVFLCFLVATVYAATAVPVDEVDNHVYRRYIQFPDGDGNPHLVDLEDQVDTDILEEVTENPADNIYLLYTRQNPTTPQTLVYNDAHSIRISKFDRRHPTLVIVHGWLGNENSDINPTIRDASLGNTDGNVIVLDWSRLARSNYVTAVRGVPAVGAGLGQFLGFLSKITGAPLDSFHLVGFSLGAHLVGFAGRELGGKVGRVTGLDPAGPLWNLNRDRLQSTDGIYVEAIHTDGDTTEGLGIGRDLGDVDFYPNGGESMPGCLTSICNHNNAWRYYAATVTYNHLIGRECANAVQLRLNRCRGQRLHMGNDDLKKSGSGRYRVNTRRRYPY